MKLLLTALFWCFLAFFLSAVLPGTAFGQVQSYHIEQYTSENGLPQNSVKAIAQCGSGFIWLSTEGGLVRFDGRNFKVFTRHELPVGSNRMRHFIRGKEKGSVFALSEHEQLIRIDGARARAVPAYNKRFSSFMTSNNDSISAHSTTGMPSIFALDVPADLAYHLPLDSGQSYVTDRDSVRFFDGKQEKWSRAFPNKNYWQFFTLGRHLFYLGSDNSLTRIGKDSVESIPINGAILSNPAFEAKEASRLYWNAVSNEVFLYLDKSLYVLEMRPEIGVDTRMLVSGFDFDLNTIYSLHYNRQNERLFLGSQTNGLFIITKQYFQTLLSDQQGLVSETYYAHSRYLNDKIITEKGNVFGPDGFHEHLPAVNYYGDSYSIFTDTAGTIWTKDRDSVYRLSPDGRKLIGKYGVPDRVTQLYQGPDGQIWIGTASKGVYQLRPDRQELKQVSPIEKEVTYLMEDPDNRLWVGTKNGLYRLALDGMNLDSISGLDSVFIRSIYISGPDEIWVTTAENGFYLYRDKRLTRFPLDREAYLASSHCILEDKQGYFWISTNRGLFQVAKRDLFAFAEGILPEVYYTYYGKDAGFKTNEFNGGCQPCGIIRDTYFSFPSLNGMVQFQPENLRAELPMSPIHIDEIEIDSASIRVTDTVRLAGRFNRMQIYFTTPYFGNPYNLYFKYKLKGLRGSGEWLEVDGQPFISFSSLPAGTYQLTIRMKTGFEAFRHQDEHVVIIVPPLFYETWWFKAAGFLVILLIILLYIRLRLKSIKKRNDELEMHIVERTVKLRQTILDQQASKDKLRRQNYLQQRLLAAITHDIKSPLQYLTLAAKTVHDQQYDQPDGFREDMKKIYRSSSRIYYFTENLVQYMRVKMGGSGLDYEDISPFEIVQEKIEIFNDIAELRKNQLLNGIDPGIMIRTNRQLLSIVIHNLLDNSVKFTRSGYIRFSSCSADGQWTLMIEDTGKGMDPELVNWCNTPRPKQSAQRSADVHTGLGLTIVLELLAMIDGKLHVSRPNQGTRFEISLHTAPSGNRKPCISQ